MALDVDYSQFITQAPPAFSGRKALYDTFAALAKAKRDRELAEMEDAQRRDASRLTYESSMYGHDITASHNAATEAGAADQRTETGRHNLATEATARTNAESAAAERRAKLWMLPGVQEALGGTDPAALERVLPALEQMGYTSADEARADLQGGPPEQPQAVEPPPLTPAQAEGAPMGEAGPAQPTGQDVDDTNQLLGEYEPPGEGSRNIRGPGGRVVYGFDPQANLRARQTAGAKIAGSMEEAAAGMGPHDAAGMRTGGKVAGLMALITGDPVGAGKRGVDYANSVAGRSQGAENARLAGQRALVVKPGQAADDKRADVNSFGNDSTRWEKNANVDKLTDAFDTFTQMNANVQNYKQQGDTVGIKGALYGAARYITGPGVLTAQEYGNTVTNTAGWTSALETKIRNGLQGEISPGEYAALEKFVNNAQKTLRQRAIRSIHSFDQKYGPSSYHGQKVPDEVSSYRASMMERFGLTEADVPSPAGAKPVDKLKALQQIGEAIRAARQGGAK